jgi:capsular polysaccharide biosynthesis protein
MSDTAPTFDHESDLQGIPGLRSDWVRWLLLFFGLTVVAAGAAFLVSSSLPPSFGARSEIVFQLDQRGTISDRFLSTQTVIVKSRAVLEPVAMILGIPLSELEDHVDVSFPKGSGLMRIEFTDDDSRAALDVTRAVTDQYVAVLEGFGRVERARFQLLSPPYLLSDPVGPKPLQATALGAALGLTIGIAGFVFAQQFRSRA